MIGGVADKTLSFDEVFAGFDDIDVDHLQI
jgi:hypothetical protein